MEKIKKILDENKSLKILIPLLLVAFVILFILYLPKQSPASPSVIVPTQTSLPNVTSAPTTLPGEIDTNFIPKTENQGDTSDASLVGPPEFKGSIRGANGVHVVIQFTNVSKILKIGESIAGYKLKAIADDDSYLTIEKDNLVTVLQISPNSN